MKNTILITKTVKYYGKEIPVEKLSKYSDKKVQVKCPICKTTRWIYAKQYFISKNTICHKCGLKKRKKDLKPGSKYNRWTVLDIGKHIGFSKCQCECGTVRDVDNSSLKQALSKSCGCLNIEQLQNRREYLKIGDRYGKLIIKDHAEKSGYSFCLCDCGKTKSVSNIHLKSKKTESCGCLKSHNLDNRVILTGENHPNWKGGISGERRRNMQTKTYKTWRSAIYEKDKYSCQKCGQVGYELNVHHIESYAEHENKRCDITNGITLCKKCHKRFHKIYGRKNINKTQLNEFLLQA